MKKIRQSNMELCRLFSILLVILVHTTARSVGQNACYGIQLLEGFSIIGVNVFVLLTGYFSATPKKSNLLNIAFICFYWMIISLIFKMVINEPIKFKDFFFISSSNWFIPSYILLIVFSPILNVFCNTVNKKALMGGALLLLVIEMWFDLVPPRVETGTLRGYSAMSFIILYLLSRAIRLYGLPNWFTKFSFWIYIGCSFVLGTIPYCLILLGKPDPIGLWYSYNNPLVIISSVAFLMSFLQFNIVSKQINYFARSTLAVLFGQQCIWILYTKQFKYLYDNYSGITIVLYWILSISIVFIASICIDQIRLILWKPLETMVEKKIKDDIIIKI